MCTTQDRECGAHARRRTTLAGWRRRRSRTRRHVRHTAISRCNTLKCANFRRDGAQVRRLDAARRRLLMHAAFTRTCTTKAVASRTWEQNARAEPSLARRAQAARPDACRGFNVGVRGAHAVDACFSQCGGTHTSGRRLEATTGSAKGWATARSRTRDRKDRTRRTGSRRAGAARPEVR